MNLLIFRYTRDTVWEGDWRLLLMLIVSSKVLVGEPNMLLIHHCVLSMSQKRKAYLIAVSEKEKSILHNRVRFITSVLSGELVVSNKRRQILIEELFAKVSTNVAAVGENSCHILRPQFVALTLFTLFPHEHSGET